MNNGTGAPMIDQSSSQMNGSRPRSSHYDTAPSSQLPNGSNGSPNQQQAQINPRQIREMSTESNGGGYRSGSNSNRALYASPPTSSTITNGYESSPSSKYSTTPVQQNPYRYSDYKPIPPPKTSVYKPVPPPKPKAYPRNGGNGSQQQPLYNGMGGPQGTATGMNGINTQPTSLPIVEGNYMNSGPQINSGGYATANHGTHRSNNMHYQSSNQYNGHHNPYSRGNQQPNNYDEDSGQGSSLDRDYGHYNNNNGYGKPHMVNGSNTMGSNQGAPPPPPGGPPPTNHSRGQYYYNMPPQNQTITDPTTNSQQQPVANGTSPRRGGDGLDLSNREYRGSAFELYKKPNQNNPHHLNSATVGNHQPHYAYANGHHQMAR